MANLCKTKTVHYFRLSYLMSTIISVGFLAVFVEMKPVKTIAHSPLAIKGILKKSIRLIRFMGVSHNDHLFVVQHSGVSVRSGRGQDVALACKTFLLSP